MSRPPVLAVGRSSSGLPGAWRYTGRNNGEMVDKFVHMGVITTKEVEDAFRAVPRGAFVPHDLQLEAYIDSPLRGEPHVHMSAPHMYATVLEALRLSPGMRICFCMGCVIQYLFGYGTNALISSCDFVFLSISLIFVSCGIKVAQ